MIARKSALIIFTQFFIRFLGWIGLVFLAKLWGGFAPYALGVVGFAISFLGIFNIISDLGFSQAHVKRVSEGKDLGKCIGTYAFIKLILIGMMTFSLFLVIYILKSILHKEFTDATTENVIYILLIYYIYLNLSRIAIHTFEGRREIAKRQLTSSAENVIKVPLEILVATAGVCISGYYVSPKFLWPGFLRGLQDFISRHVLGAFSLSYVFGAIAVLSIGLYFLRNYPCKKPDLRMMKSYFSFALPIMLISIISVISVNIDKIMIGYFWTSVEVGYYYSMQQILQVIFIISTSVGMVLFPTISEYHANKNFRRINSDTRKAERYISMVTIPVAVLMITLSKPLINIILNSSFLPAAPVLIVLTIYALINSLNIPYSSLVRGVDRPDIGAKIGVSICAVNICLNYLFIPKNGLLSFAGINGPTGAAVATLLSSLVGFFGLRIASKRLTGIKLLQFHTPIHVFAGIITGLVIHYLSSFISLMRWYHLISLSVLGIGIYSAILFLLKELNKEDLQFFLDILNPKGMLRYVKREIKG